MSTTRHLINRQRRLAAVSAAAQPRTAAPARARTAAPAEPAHVTPDSASAPGAGVVSDAGPDDDRDADSDAGAEAGPDAGAGPRPGAAQTPEISEDAPGTSGTSGTPERARVARPRLRRPSRSALLAALLALLTVLLGGFAAWAAGRASDLRGSADTGNAALTDTARTSEVKGTVAQDVNAVFSYDYADVARTDNAAKRVLTGRAVQQYATMLVQVRAQAPAEKLVLTTTVTGTGVEMIDGDRARVLVFADQRNTSTAKGGGTTYAAAMFTVDALRQDGTWKIAAIDTFG